jgi:hypothetical protein
VGSPSPPVRRLVILNKEVGTSLVLNQMRRTRRECCSALVWAVITGLLLVFARGASACCADTPSAHASSSEVASSASCRNDCACCCIPAENDKASRAVQTACACTCSQPSGREVPVAPERRPELQVRHDRPLILTAAVLTARSEDGQKPIDARLFESWHSPPAYLLHRVLRN